MSLDGRTFLLLTPQIKEIQKDELITVINTKTQPSQKSDSLAEDSSRAPAVLSVTNMLQTMDYGHTAAV